MIRAALCTALALTSVLAATRAFAGPGDATRLEYARSEGAAKCPDRDALKNAVRKRLGYDPFFPAARQTVVVEITDQNAALRARMSLVNEQGVIVGSRELEESSAHCDELVASLALAISIALDPSAALDVPAPAEEPKAQPDQATDPQPAPEPDPAPPPATPKPPPNQANERRLVAPLPPPESSLAISARAGGFTSLGVAPALATGLRLGLGLRHRWFELVAEFAEQFPARHDANGGGSARASLNEAVLAPCVAKEWLAGCALFSIGSLQSEGLGVPQPINASTLYLALGARIELEPQLIGPLYLVLNADLQKSLSPITLRLRGEDVWKTPFISGALGAGLALLLR